MRVSGTVINLDGDSCRAGLILGCLFIMILLFGDADIPVYAVIALDIAPLATAAEQGLMGV